MVESFLIPVSNFGKMGLISKLHLCLVILLAVIYVTDGQGTGVFGSFSSGDKSKDTTEEHSPKPESSTGESATATGLPGDEEEEEVGEEEVAEKEKKGEKKEGEGDEENEKLIGDEQMDLGRKNCKDDDEANACEEACEYSGDCTGRLNKNECGDDCFKMCRYAEKWITRKCTNHMMAHIKYYRDMTAGTEGPAQIKAKSVDGTKKSGKDGVDGTKKSGKDGVDGTRKSGKKGEGAQAPSKQQAPSKDAQSGSGGEGLSGLLSGGANAPSLLGDNPSLLG